MADNEFHPASAPLTGAGPQRKAAREAAGLTQWEACIRVGVALSTYVKWETASHKPSRIGLRKLVAAFPSLGSA
jgi:DNA-binding XRE family transcriptional regulator